MATTTTGQWLNQYVAPQLLSEFKNDKADFLGVLPGAPAAAITADGLRYNKLINNVGFYVDNTSAFTPKSMTGSKTFVEWEKYDTDPTQVTDAEIRSLAFDKRNEVRVKHSEAFRRGIRDHVIWKLAPEDATVAYMPTLRTTGASDGNGRKRMAFKDLVSFLEMVKALNLPDEQSFFLKLCTEHVTDLILDRDSAAYFAGKDVFFDPTSGKLRSFMGFKFFENAAGAAYTSDGMKKAKGAVLTSGDQNASVFFYAPNVVYHLESSKILYKPEIEDTRNADPTSEFRIQTYGLVDRIVDYGFGAIISGNV